MYALQAVGLTGEEPPVECVEDLASRYVSEVHSRLPSEKVLLAGYSFGGMVAWEMADQLLDAGREVAFVGLINVSPHHSSTTS